MILQELARFYDRKNQEGDMPRPGFSKQAIKYILVINSQGELLELIDREIKIGKKSAVPLLDSPTLPERQSNAAKIAGFIVDKPKYIFGNYPQINKPDYVKAYRAFLERCYADTKDEGLASYLLFLDEASKQCIPEETLSEILKAKNEPIIGIQLFEDFGKYDYLWMRPDLENWYLNQQNDEESNVDTIIAPVYGQCLLSGKENVELARIHGKLNAGFVSDKNAALVSFNTDKPSFCSYGKTQSYNAPTSNEAEQAYVSALQYLYNKESTQRLRMAGTVLAFWTDKKSPFEEDFPSYFEDWSPREQETTANDSQQETQAVQDAKAIYKSPHTGYLDLDRYQQDTQFYVLGLSPNSARLSVRFWYQGSVLETAKRMAQHLEDLKIIHGPDDPDYLPLLPLLRVTAFEYKTENINPRLQSEMIRAILQGTPYPMALLQGVLYRVKAERKVGYKRAALLKAYLNRQFRFYPQPHQQPIGVTMDEQNMNPAYRLGRLFAILEHLQERAQGSVNAGIRDRYYNSASTTPRAVFGRLIRLSHHHLGKIEGGQKIRYSQLIGQAIEPINPVSNFPAYFSLEEQGIFALGYYQQRQWFFTKKTDEKAVESEILVN